MELPTARLLNGFDDPACDDATWAALVERSDTNVVYLAKPWLRAWWEHLGEGQLLLVAAIRDGRTIALAPFYAVEGMVFFLGAGESDYLDVIGEQSDPVVVAALLQTAQRHAEGFVGFRLHLVPDRSRTRTALVQAAELARLDLVEEAVLPSVDVDLRGRGAEVMAAIEGGMLRRENYCRRNGELLVRRLGNVEEIGPQLPDFYAMHVARWKDRGIESQYAESRQRAFLERFLTLSKDADWVRVLLLEWNSVPIAIEFAWYYRGVYYPGPWAFDVRFAKQSPGQILLRQSILAALESGLHTYDLGGGDQAYKLRLPATLHDCRTWGLYPY